MKKLICNTRFIERDYQFEHILHNSKHLTHDQINQILDGIGNWNDLTFKFYSDGYVVILDNRTEQIIKPQDLTGVCKDYYYLKRIQMLLKPDNHTVAV